MHLVKGKNWWAGIGSVVHSYAEIYRAAQNIGDHFKKNMAFLEGNNQFAGDFCANMDETNADIVQFTKIWSWELIVQHQGYLQKVCCHKCQFCTKVCASSRLASQVHMMTGKNIKKMYWCVTSQPKYWNNMQFHTQIYIT